MRLAGLQSRQDTLREPRLGISTASDSSGLSVTGVAPGGAASAAGLRVGDRIVSLGDVTITSDDSFDAFRQRYNGTAITTLPVVVRRGAETITLQMPVRLFSRIVTVVKSIPGAPEKAVRIRNGIMKGTTQ
jgi:S1-C subfamily serine protease